MTKTQEQFIIECKRAHGDKYNYDKTIYKGVYINVKIKCQTHGIFEQNPRNHIKGHGCKKCGHEMTTNIQTKTQEQFIIDIKKVHGDKYDYSKVIYVSAKDDIEIICKEHGVFQQLAYNHLSGSGCINCGYKSTSDKQRKTQEQFITDIKQVHGDRYDYSKVIYIKSSDEIEIICNTHGVFHQIASGHLSGAGCFKCSIKERSKKQTKTLEQFIIDAKEIHGGKYDYSKVVYIRNSENIEIICITHGLFQQTPSAHISGSGCAKCANKLASQKLTKTLDQFIIDAKEVHGNKYNYDEGKYEGAHIKLKIKCQKHGIFDQTPSSHLSGCGCSKCANEESSTNQRKSLEQFILDAKKIHEDLYNYDNVVYITCNDEVEIICKKHDKFQQIPSVHLSGSGCNKCSIEERANNKRKSLKQFIIEARNLHGDKYDYNSVIYKNNNTDIEIVCNNHGIFYQTPSGHLLYGCSKCGNESASFLKTKTLEQFISESREVHGDKYDYSKVIYIQSDIKVEIICKIHGSFNQCPSKHINQNGCPFCKNKTEGKVNDFLNTLSIPFIFQPKYDWCKNKTFLPFDFVIESLKLIIEIDGDQHFKDMPNWYSTKVEVLENDIFKMKKAIENGYRIVRLLQTEIWDNKYDWKKVLNENINNILEIPDLTCISTVTNKSLYGDHLKLIDNSKILIC